MPRARTAVPRFGSAVCLTLAAGLAQAAPLNVPAEFPTIQAAINAAQAGDEVIVAPGTYNERISFLGKNIVVRSSGGAAVTTISGGGIGPVVQFVNGEPSTARLEGFTITGGIVSGEGAGVAYFNSSAKILDSVISSNVVPFGRGAGIGIVGGQPELVRVRLENNLVGLPNSTAGGGGVAISGGGTITIRDSEFISNKVLSGRGGGLMVEPGASAVVSGTRFEGNDAEASSGGGIAVDGGSLVVTNCQFVSNFSTFGSGAGIEATNPVLLEVSGSLFEGNSTPDGGGPGGIDLSGGSATISTSQFIDNVANGGSGAGIGARNTTLIVNGCTFTGNNADGGAGGGIAVEGTGAATVTDSVFTNNRAESGSGGAVAAYDSFSMTFQNCTFTGNLATSGSGGAIYAEDDTTVNLVGGTLTTNVGTSSVSAAVWFLGSTLTVDGTSFVGNGTPTSLGGGIYAGRGTVTVLDAQFTGNAGVGGGIALVGSGPATIRGTRFTGHISAGGGAALRVAGTRTVSVENSVFASNSTTSGLGGAVLTSDTTNVRFVNSVFANNSSPGALGASLGMRQSSVVLLANCTLAGNPPRPQGGAIAVRELAGLTVVNSIVEGDASAGSLLNISQGVGAPPVSVTYSSVSGGFAGVGNISAPPIFVDPSAGNFRLQPGSPGIDAGSNPAVPAGVTTDFDGNTRFADDPGTPDTGVPGGAGGSAITDMGAFERQASGACYANCDGSTGTPALTPADFVCFLNKFRAGDPYANCDGSTGTPVLTPADFVCFLTAFRAGCP